MTTLQINSVSPIDGVCNNIYEGIAFDGCDFYLTAPNCREIHRFDTCFCRKECISTCRGYSSITYDHELKCFWAISHKVANRIFKLNSCLQEIDYLRIKSCDCTQIFPTGIACPQDTCKLLLSCPQGILEISKTDCTNACLLIKAAPGTHFTSIEEMDDQYLCSLCKSQCRAIVLCSPCGNTSFKCCLPDDYQIKDMSSVFCAHHAASPTAIYVLAAKRCCYPYIFKCSLNHCEDTPVCCADNCQEHDCCHCEDQHHIDCMKSCNSIIESIALIETALSHILNAEGEKIQKVLSSTDDSCEIMKANETVGRAIINITHLEQVLYAKLQLAKEFFSDTCPNICQDTCPNTCPDICPNTCHNTCSNTCSNVCQDTCCDVCRDTCQNICSNSSNEPCVSERVSHEPCNNCEPCDKCTHGMQSMKRIVCKLRVQG